MGGHEVQDRGAGRKEGGVEGGQAFPGLGVDVGDQARGGVKGRVRPFVGP